jgi:transcriptional regulator with XRE-family HTH domain
MRQLAKELGVSASYLSQVKNGKRPLNQKVLSNVKQNSAGLVDASMLNRYNIVNAGVAELADAADLKSAGAILVGSSPAPGTKVRG